MEKKLSLKEVQRIRALVSEAMDCGALDATVPGETCARTLPRERYTALYWTQQIVDTLEQRGAA